MVGRDEVDQARARVQRVGKVRKAHALPVAVHGQGAGAPRAQDAEEPVVGRGLDRHRVPGADERLHHKARRLSEPVGDEDLLPVHAQPLAHEVVPHKRAEGLVAARVAIGQ